MFDYLLDHIDQTIDKSLIQDYQRLLKTGTAQAADPKYNIGGWKLLNNAVGDIETIDYRHVDEEIGKLLGVYNTHVAKGHAITLTQIAAFHARFEQIHPFLDGNGRTGRIIMFQQCLQADIMPFIVMDETKDTYYHALDDWQTKGVVEPLLNYFEECQARYENICEYYLEGKELLVDLGRTDVQLDYRKLFDGQDS
jgi:Fic family protein